MIKALILTILGALPFGLVNLSVIKTTLQKNLANAMLLALGATGVEVFFALTAYYFSDRIHTLLSSSSLTQVFSIALIFIIGTYFFIKKEKAKSSKELNTSPFFEGVFLNLISIQVFLYWIVALVLFQNLSFSYATLPSSGYFIVGVISGKMGVLYLFAIFTRQFIANSAFIFNNINRIIGIVLMVAGVFQSIKIIS